MNGRVNFLLFQKHAETNRARIVTQARPVLKLDNDFFTGQISGKKAVFQLFQAQFLQQRG